MLEGMLGGLLLGGYARGTCWVGLLGGFALEIGGMLGVHKSATLCTQVNSELESSALLCKQGLK